jgi:hypothetical protein
MLFDAVCMEKPSKKSQIWHDMFAKRVARCFLFKLKIPNLGKFWRAFGIFHDHLVRFVFIFSCFGIVYQGKSGNPVCEVIEYRSVRCLMIVANDVINQTRFPSLTRNLKSSAKTLRIDWRAEKMEIGIRFCKSALIHRKLCFKYLRNS